MEDHLHIANILKMCELTTVTSVLECLVVLDTVKTNPQMININELRIRAA
jgi:hypothetical protein